MDPSSLRARASPRTHRLRTCLVAGSQWAQLLAWDLASCCPEWGPAALSPPVPGPGATRCVASPPGHCQLRALLGRQWLCSGHVLGTPSGKEGEGVMPRPTQPLCC